MRNLHARLAPLGLWTFVTREWDTESVNLHFHCDDVDGLKAALPGLGFTRPAATRTGFWQAIERRSARVRGFEYRLPFRLLNAFAPQRGERLIHGDAIDPGIKGASLLE